jgi:hypothetical protein
LQERYDTCRKHKNIAGKAMLWRREAARKAASGEGC